MLLISEMTKIHNASSSVIRIEKGNLIFISGIYIVAGFSKDKISFKSTHRKWSRLLNCPSKNKTFQLMIKLWGIVPQGCKFGWCHLSRLCTEGSTFGGTTRWCGQRTAQQQLLVVAEAQRRHSEHRGGHATCRLLLSRPLAERTPKKHSTKTFFLSKGAPFIYLCLKLFCRYWKNLISWPTYLPFVVNYELARWCCFIFIPSSYSCTFFACLER